MFLISSMFVCGKYKVNEAHISETRGSVWRRWQREFSVGTRDDVCTDREATGTGHRATSASGGGLYATEIDATLQVACWI